MVGGASLLIHTLVAYLLLPWLTTRTSRISPVVSFVALIFWGWMWGIAGVILAVPILAAFKIFCAHIKEMEPIAEFLS